MLKNDPMTRPAGQFGAPGHDHTILRRYDVEPLALVRTNLKERAVATRTTRFARHQGFDDARQMLRQLAMAGSPLGCLRLAHVRTGTILGRVECCDSLIDVLQNQLQLIGIKPFRGTTEPHHSLA